jgi:transposase
VPARKALNLLADQLVDTQRKIEDLTADIHADAKASDAAQRLQTIPGIGPITASALVAALPDVSDFRSGRDLSASCRRHAFGVTIGLTPKPHSTGGKERLGRISKMGNKYLRRLLYLGAIAQVSARRRVGGRRRLAVEDHRAQKAQTGRHRFGQPHGPNRLCASEETEPNIGRPVPPDRNRGICSKRKASASRQRRAHP